MLEALGHIGEFVGAIGVVISLVYLARQMIQNTISVRAASFNSMVQNSIRLLEHAFRDSEFAAFLARAEGDPSSLTREERVRWDAYMTAVYRHFGNLVYAYRVGTLDRQMWESYRATLKDHLRTRSWADWYQQHRHLFSTALNALVDQCLAENAADGSAAWTSEGASPSSGGREAPASPEPARRIVRGDEGAAVARSVESTS